MDNTPHGTAGGSDNPFHADYGRNNNGAAQQPQQTSPNNDVTEAVATTRVNPFEIAIAQQQQQQQPPHLQQQQQQQQQQQPQPRAPSSRLMRMMADEAMPKQSIMDTMPRRVSRAPTFGAPMAPVGLSSADNDDDDEYDDDDDDYDDEDSLEEGEDAGDGQQQPLVPAAAVPQFAPAANASAWSRFFAPATQDPDPPTTITTTVPGTDSAAAAGTNADGSSPTARMTRTVSFGAEVPDNQAGRNRRGSAPIKNAKQRQTRRRWRFRQGMRQAGIALGVHEEGDLETERTSHITEEDLDRDFDSVADGLRYICSWESGWLQMGLLCVLCFLVMVLIVGVVIYFLGGWSFLYEDSTPPAPVNAEPTDTVVNGWLWDSRILDGPPIPVRDLLPEFTLKAVKDDKNGPQAKALQWLDEHPNINGMENWKKVQLVALVSFYHAFNGEEWPEEKRKDWLNYDKDECLWGDPGKDGQYFGVGCYVGSDPDKAGKFRALNLDWFLGFGMVGFPDSIEGNRMPPEIIFLTHLEQLGLMNSGLVATLTNLLPPTLAQMPLLSRLSYRFNRIEGTIPPMIGALTNLEYLSLGSNYVTGMQRSLRSSTLNIIAHSMPRSRTHLTNLILVLLCFPCFAFPF